MLSNKFFMTKDEYDKKTKDKDFDPCDWGFVPAEALKEPIIKNNRENNNED